MTKKACVESQGGAELGRLVIIHRRYIPFTHDEIVVASSRVAQDQLVVQETIIIFFFSDQLAIFTSELLSFVLIWIPLRDTVLRFCTLSQDSMIVKTFRPWSDTR